MLPATFTLTGAGVRRLRRALGLTQAELARQLGYTRYAIYFWERHGDAPIPRVQQDRVLATLEAEEAAQVAYGARLTALQNLYNPSTSGVAFRLARSDNQG